VVYVRVGEKVAGKCEGSAALPSAVAGYLCVYAGLEKAEGGFHFKDIQNATGAEGASKFGAAVAYETSTSEPATTLVAQGSWAVNG
jgi:hypothetical protein